MTPSPFLQSPKVNSKTGPVASWIRAMVLIFGGALYLQGCGETSDSLPPLGPLSSYQTGVMEGLETVDDPKAFADQQVQVADGSYQRLSAYKGKALLINFWASWCAPCRAEMKDLVALQAQVGSDDFEVMAINADRGGLKMAARTLEDWGVLGLALYADPKMALLQEYATKGLPTSLIVSKEGRIIAQYLGELDWDAPEAIAYFKALREGAR